MFPGLPVPKAAVSGGSPLVMITDRTVGESPLSLELDHELVIHYPWLRRVVIGSLYSFLTWILVYISCNDATLADILSLAILIRYVLEKRRKLAISQSEIAYWPPFGHPRRAFFSEIISIEKTKVGRWFGARSPELVSGIELQLPNYELMKIPLDIPNEAEVFDKINATWRAASRKT